jgi:nitroimidazol reductase NimA-like FMN-containing flavoprotein (pyridoxamine 5'-phosphate oxidase superfamily)
MLERRKEREAGTMLNLSAEDARMSERMLESLGEDECLRLISAGGIGRIAYQSRFGPAILPVNYKLYGGAVVFRTTEHSPLDEDLRTGIADAEYRVAFEIDEFDPAAHQGWSVLIQGSAHHVQPGADHQAAEAAGVQPWPDGERELFVRIIPSRITGRRIGARDV